MGSENGTHRHEKKLEEIQEDLHFVKETIVPISHALIKIPQSVDRLSANIENLSVQLESFLIYNATLSERYRKDIVKFAGVLLFLIFGLVFGAESAAKLAKGIF